jgi:hypothetical protein
MVDKTSRAVLWFCALHRPWSTSNFCLGLKCFSDTTVDISFDVVNVITRFPTHPLDRLPASGAFLIAGWQMIRP